MTTLAARKEASRGRITLSVPVMITLIYVLALFIVGMPLDGKLGQFSVGSTGEPIAPEPGSGSARALYVALVWGGFYAASVIFLFGRSANIVHAVRAMPFYLAFLCYLAMSTQWSSNPSRGLFDLAQLTGSVVLCFCVALRYRDNFEGWLLHTALALGAAQLLNFLLTLGFPSLTIAPNGRWAGVYGAPNYLGSLAFVSIWANLAALFLIRPKRWLIYLILAAVSTSNLAGTNSVTSIWCTAIALGLIAVWPILMATGRGAAVKRIALLIFLYVFVLLYMLGIADVLVEMLFSASGRTVNMTGRSAIWAEATTAIANKPILGHGFGTRLSIIAIERISDLHSTYMDILFSGGAIGLTLFGLALLQIAFAAWRWRNIKAVAIRALMPLLMAILFYNSAETALLDARSPILLLFLVASTLITLKPVAPRITQQPVPVLRKVNRRISAEIGARP